MKWRHWEELHQELQACQRFTKVGEPLDPTPSNVRRVPSWELACEWASAEISWWCKNEAANILRLPLNDHHRPEYRKWNDHIKSFTPARDELVEQIVSPLVPESSRLKIANWVRSQLTGAYLECVYSQFAEVHLVCDQVEWYLQGRFPCGWMVKDEISFPDEAVTIIF
ncbi:MAG TPA: hypothetical protein VFG20_17660 [Planctomycetaceae bacterium]|jgi:hypothetical protein|nr:hypothetical protein [Planctomycetaceae bacterium]